MSVERLPHITVVLPTRQRPESLERVLRGLARQVDPGLPWDVVVVDNDAMPGTVRDSSSSVIAELPVPVRVVVEPELGASNARNRGIAEATGSIIAFIDDDVVPDDDWLCEVVRPLLDGEWEGVGGRVDLDPAVPRPAWLSSWLSPYLAEFRPAEEGGDLQRIARKRLSEAYLLTANAAFTADVLERAGGFDPELGPRDGNPFVNDDIGLCREVFAAGGRIRYEPRARVVHELPAGRLRRRYLLRRLHAQGRSDWMLERHVLRTARSGGVVAGFEHLASDVRAAIAEREKRPVPRWLLYSAARRAGFLREAVVHLCRRALRRA